MSVCGIKQKRTSPLRLCRWGSALIYFGWNMHPCFNGRKRLIQIEANNVYAIPIATKKTREETQQHLDQSESMLY